MITKLRNQKEIPTPKTEMGKPKLSVNHQGQTNEMIKALMKQKRGLTDTIICLASGDRQTT